ncbi:hypothetical protein [Corynebacterium aurimucosum]|uniref:hypothetical protein n=1 Tax=Corynebacterium aurimucosum TaxID=169292 RepID=UPI000C7FCD02|nr:hypothetical protein [Corynebacterium aurimucosum]PMC71689.1 hypothetical protein CJ201_03420 [Corynebacterium aurimucosum]
MFIRRIAATAAAVVTLGAVVPATASATSFEELGGFLSQGIQNADCNTLRSTLMLIDQTTEGELLGPDTTRNQLSKNLMALGNSEDLGALALAAVKYSGQTADRALECKIVKEDTIVTGGTGLSSTLTDYAPLLSSIIQKG